MGLVVTPAVPLRLRALPLLLLTPLGLRRSSARLRRWPRRQLRLPLLYATGCRHTIMLPLVLIPMLWMRLMLPPASVARPPPALLSVCEPDVGATPPASLLQLQTSPCHAVSAAAAKKTQATRTTPRSGTSRTIFLSLSHGYRILISSHHDSIRVTRRSGRPTRSGLSNPKLILESGASVLLRTKFST